MVGDTQPGDAFGQGGTSLGTSADNGWGRADAAHVRLIVARGSGVRPAEAPEPNDKVVLAGLFESAAGTGAGDDASCGDRTRAAGRDGARVAGLGPGCQDIGVRAGDAAPRPADRRGVLRAAARRRQPLRRPGRRRGAAADRERLGGPRPRLPRYLHGLPRPAARGWRGAGAGAQGPEKEDEGSEAEGQRGDAWQKQGTRTARLGRRDRRRRVAVRERGVGGGGVEGGRGDVWRGDERQRQRHGRRGQGEAPDSRREDLVAWGENVSGRADHPHRC
mmetsp:Transcript_95024/g.307474  ORF Transcript_95024/g.307474 Transcript_95024/m.307474 type:complete len:276 (-) Transcript_95024:4669-5496(-)